MQSQETFPFVVGCPRSGTTLLRAMLDSHPRLAIPPESFFVPELATATRQDLGRGQVVAKILAHERLRRWGLPEHEVADAVRHAADGPAATRSLYSLYARHHGKPLYADKTPQYVTSIDTLAAAFAEARFVHLIRDGRDVALALLDAPFGPTNIASAARMWRRNVSCGRRSGQQLGASRYLEVRYEDLVRAPGDVLATICDFVKLPFDAGMLEYWKRADSVIAGMPHPQALASVRMPPTVGLRDWRQAMPSLDVGVFEWLAGDLLTELHYARAHDTVNMAHRMEARRQVTRNSCRRVGRRIRLYGAAAWRRLMAGNGRSRAATGTTPNAGV